MKHLFILSLFIVLCHPIPAQGQHYSRVKVLLKPPVQTIQVLAEQGIAVDHGDYIRGEYFISDFSDLELKTMKDAGFATEIIIEDVVSYYQQQNKYTPEAIYRSTNSDPIIPPHFSPGSYGGYFTYDEMLLIFQQMHTLYPELITELKQIDTFSSVEGRPIYWLKIAGKKASATAKPQILYTALHHAREPGSLSQLIFYMWYLLDNYGKNDKVTAIIDHTELYFIPCVNPDGYMHNIITAPKTGGMWRKNRRPHTNGSYGVDINRNYGHQWGMNGGASPSPHDETYRGPAPFSEPETRAVKWFTETHHFLIALNHHTFSNVLLYPWGGSNPSTEPPESAIYTPLARMLTKHNKYRYGVCSEMLGYTTSGDANDWMYGGTQPANKVFAFTTEMGTSFYTPADQIIPDCKNTLAMNLNAAASVLPFAMAESTDSAVKKNISGQLHYDITFTSVFTSGTFTVSAEPLDKWMNPITITRVYSNKQPGETVRDSIPYTLHAAIAGGETVRYLLKVDNGYYTDVDTVVFNYREVPLKLSVYPNPVKGKLIIKITGDEIEFPINACLYNIAGQRIRNIQLTDTITEVNTDDLSTSVYFLKTDNSKYHFPITKIVVGN